MRLEGGVKRMALDGIDAMQLFAGRGKEKEMNLRSPRNCNLGGDQKARSARV